MLDDIKLSPLIETCIERISEGGFSEEELKEMLPQFARIAYREGYICKLKRQLKKT